VVVEPDTPPSDISRRIDALMEPYDQDSETAEWVLPDEEPCECMDQASGAGYDDKDEAAWQIEQAEILKRYPDHFAISIDFHY
jgi:hypothetical protein